MKFILGFVLLRTKLASWRYQRASKPISLVSSVPKTTITEVIVETNKTEMDSEIEDEDIPPVIEDIFEYLIQGMRDKAIVIRYLSLTFAIYKFLSLNLKFSFFPDGRPLRALEE